MFNRFLTILDQFNWHEILKDRGKKGKKSIRPVITYRKKMKFSFICMKSRKRKARKITSTSIYNLS